MLRSTSTPLAPSTQTNTNTDTPTISFQNTSNLGQTTQWSDSTDIAEFIREAAHSAKFSITVEYPPHLHSQNSVESDKPDHTGIHTHVNDTPSQPPPAPPPIKTSLEVDVPTFADRIHYIRKRLQLLQHQLTSMDSLKHTCDHEARKGAQRMALGGFGMLIVYWGAVARLTFWDYGWYVSHILTLHSQVRIRIC